jgi:hypothetical protein
MIGSVSELVEFAARIDISWIVEIKPQPRTLWRRLWSWSPIDSWCGRKVPLNERRPGVENAAGVSGPLVLTYSQEGLS